MFSTSDHVSRAVIQANIQILRGKNLFPNVQSKSLKLPFVALIILFTATQKSLALSSLLLPIEYIPRHL